MDTTARFFELLRSGLWDKPADISFFSDGNVDWEGIIRMAMEQAVAGVVFDGMGTLPADLRPSKARVMQWYAWVVRIEQANELLNRELAHLVAFYQSKGIQPVLLKGQGVASIYPHPEHRQCGDIDMYFGEHYKRAKELIATQHVEFGEEGEKHVEYTYNGVSVENHHYVVRLFNPRQNRICQRWINEWWKEDKGILQVHGIDVQLPAPGFNAIYLLIHSLLHFIPEGVGLRQICDWTLTLKTYAHTIDKERLIREVRRLKLEDVFTTFGYIAVRYLGLPADCMPFPTEKAQEAGEFLLKDTLEGGNFGKNRTGEKQLPKVKWRKVLYNYRYIRNRCNQMKTFCRTEARWYPYFRALNLIYKKFHGLD